ncbi:hypothetical protein E0493_11135 [Roseomonas sp. M0104]|uniref:Uncharacterized protein n=1 Tax=Teichococcus coralli TaxID=2545983 RepID=A0A845BKF9_9PROT|nr:hypothetical protein [Pseudoroseomonas coralli]
MKKPEAQNPMHKAHAAPRCGARTRGNTSCMAPAMANGRCRMHGGASTGPRTAEGLASIRAAQTIHGSRGAEMRSLRRHMRALLASTAELKGST